MQKEVQMTLLQKLKQSYIEQTFVLDQLQTMLSSIIFGNDIMPMSNTRYKMSNQLKLRNWLLTLTKTLCILVILIKSSQEQIHYQSPTFKYNSSNLIATINPPKTLHLTNFYIISHSIKNTLQIYSIQNYSLLYRFFNDSLLYKNQICLAFDIQQDGKILAVLSERNYIWLVHLDANVRVANVFVNQDTILYTDVQIINQQLLLLGIINNTYLIKRYYQNNFTVIDQTHTLVNTFFGNLKMKTCTQNNSAHYFINVIWISKCDIQIFNCTYLAYGCQSIHHYFNSSCNITQYSYSQVNQDISFNKDCSKLIFTFSESTTQIWNLLTGVKSNPFILDDNTLNYDSFFQDGDSIYIGTVAILNVPIVSLAVNSNIADPFYGTINKFSLYHQKIISATTTNITTFNMKCSNTTLSLIEGICKKCPHNCTNCNVDTGFCTSCLLNYSLTNNSCLLPQLILINTTNTTNTPTINSAKPIHPYESEIGNSVKTIFFDNLQSSITNFFYLLQVFPISFMFIKFINFWSICSLYALTRVKLPLYLRQILMQIYSMINSSLFSALKINSLRTNLQLPQKYDNEMVQIFGLSSNYLQFNFQNLCLLLVSYLIMTFCFTIRFLMVKKGSQIGLMMLGQYISAMNSFFLTTSTLCYKSYQNNSYQKINIIIQHFSIISSLIVPLYILIKIKRFNKQNQQSQRMQWFVNYLCNSLMPAIAVFGNLCLFTIGNLILFYINLKAAINSNQYKINNILISIHFIIFHLGFILLNTFDQQQYPQVYHHVGLVMVVIILIGALHQISTIIVKSIYQFFCLIRKQICSSLITDISIKNQIPQKIKQNSKTNIQKNLSQNEGQLLKLVNTYDFHKIYNNKQKISINLNKQLYQDKKMPHLQKQIYKKSKMSSISKQIQNRNDFMLDIQKKIQNKSNLTPRLSKQIPKFMSNRIKRKRQNINALKFEILKSNFAKQLNT